MKRTLLKLGSVAKGLATVPLSLRSGVLTLCQQTISPVLLKTNNMLKVSAPAFLFLFLLSGALHAQVTTTIHCTGTAGSYHSGTVTNAAGGYLVTDGDPTAVSNGSNEGWASFDLSAIPSGS